MYNMSKQTKASKTVTATATAPVVTPIVAPVVVPEVPAPKVKKVKAPKQEAVATETVQSVKVAAAPVVAAAPAAVTSAADEVVTDVVELDTSLMEKSADFVAKLQQIGALMSSLKTEYKTLEKQWSKELKAAQKQSSKRKKRAGNRAPSGFVKPTKISDELAKFLEKPIGSEMARTEVTRDINTYIRTNNLQDKENGRKIIPDSKLSTLLKISKGEELTYFNLQRYMSPHFSKANKPPTAESAAV